MADANELRKNLHEAFRRLRKMEAAFAAHDAKCKENAARLNRMAKRIEAIRRETVKRDEVFEQRLHSINNKVSGLMAIASVIAVSIIGLALSVIFGG